MTTPPSDSIPYAERARKVSETIAASEQQARAARADFAEMRAAAARAQQEQTDRIAELRATNEHARAERVELIRQMRETTPPMQWQEIALLLRITRQRAQAIGKEHGIP